MRWIAVSTGEMAMIADPRIVRRKRFLTDVTTRYVSHCSFDNASMGMLTDTIFFAMHQVLKLPREPRYTIFIATKVMRR